MKKPIFPVRVTWNEELQKFDKRPLIAGWQSSMMTREEISTENYGVTVPDGRVVIDLDLYKNATAKDALAERFDVKLDGNSFLQKTISGGEHHAFSVPPGLLIEQGADKLGIAGFDTRCSGRGWLCCGEGYQQNGMAPEDKITSDNLPELPKKLLDALTVQRQTQQPIEQYTQTAPQYERAREALTFLDPSMPRDPWVKIGMALYNTPGGMGLFDEWSQQGDNYRTGEVQKIWETFAGSQVNIESLFWMATKAGWESDEYYPMYDPSDFGEIAESASEELSELFVDYDYDGPVRMPGFVLEGLIQKGFVAFAGQGGAGKTTTIIPMAVAATGCLPSYPAQPLLPQRVLYIAEDAGQAARCVRSLKSQGLLTGGLTERFKIIQGHKQALRKWVPYAKEFDLVVFDTVAFNLLLEDENSNTEVANLIASMRGSMDCNIWIVAHATKSNRNTEDVQVRGASAWQDNAQQVVAMTRNEAGERYMEITKHRFELQDYDTSELYRIETYTIEDEGVNELGELIPINIRYNWIEIDSKAERTERRIEARDDKNRQRGEDERERRIGEIMSLVNEQPGLTKAEICDRVKGYKGNIRDDLSVLLRQGNIREERNSRRVEIFGARDPEPF